MNNKKQKIFLLWSLGPLIALFAVALFPAKIVQAAGASLSISPASGVYEVGATVDISFLLDTGGVAVNTVNADIRFPADKLQVVNPAASTSFISLWVTAPSYSNTDGTLLFQGGLPTPGIKTSAGVISTVTFRVKSAGKATISFATTSRVLQNDGEGTNILRSTGTADLTLKSPPPAGPIVTSPTHANANQWYNNPQILLQWEPVAGASGYSFVFDQAAKTVPPDTINVTATTASGKATGDGVWYFHIKAKTGDGWGGVTHIAFQIDVTAPAAFSPKLDKSTLTTEEVGTLRWLTTDGASGIDHYEMKQVASAANPGQSTLFVETNSPAIIAKLPAGKYDFIVRAIDRAGNMTDGTTTLTVVAAGVSYFARTPFLRNPAVANTVIIVLVLLVLGFATWFILRRVRIRSTFRGDLRVLEHDASRKYEELQRELEELRQAKDIMQTPPANAGPPAAPPPVPPHP